MNAEKVLFALLFATCATVASCGKAWYFWPMDMSYRKDARYSTPVYRFLSPYSLDMIHAIARTNKPETFCAPGEVKCSHDACATVCNGMGECSGNEDESSCKKQCEDIPTCQKGQMYCPDSGECVGICDGKKECLFGEDEKNCRKKCQYREMLCNDGVTCATPCNGRPECQHADDEKFCRIFDKCNAQKIAECLCKASLYEFSSYDQCARRMIAGVLECIEVRDPRLAMGLNLEPGEVCLSESRMSKCLCEIVSLNFCGPNPSTVSPCIN